MKVIYPQEQRDAAATARQTERIRQETYEKVKRELLLTLLELEKRLPGSKCMGAGAVSSAGSVRGKQEVTVIIRRTGDIP